jgi:hypothetical protein
MRQNAYNRVLEKMFEEDESKKWTLGAMGTSSISVSPITTTASAITIGDQTLTAADIARLKKHKTLFGRLFV